MKVRHDVFMVCISLLIALLLSCNQNKNQWSGRIENKDGLTTVQNPKEVLHPYLSFQFEEDLKIGKDEGSAEYLLNSISIFNVDKNGTIFINDQKPQSIKVFDKNGIYVRNWKEGAGTGRVSIR
ncbi:MAG: hypothetical protein MUP70_09075 [Candidatus Aminicenantes bacterium]|nr:hypothetical protein [Candidatus Aminicenantes bacterium]